MRHRCDMSYHQLLNINDLKNSGNDRNEIEVSVEIPVPARFRARDRKEFLQNFEPSPQVWNAQQMQPQQSQHQMQPQMSQHQMQPQNYEQMQSQQMPPPGFPNGQVQQNTGSRSSAGVFGKQSNQGKYMMNLHGSLESTL